MQIGLRFHDAKVLPFEERIREVKNQGFSCVHMALSKVMPNPALSAPEALTPGYAMYLKRCFQREGMDVAVLGCYFNLANPNPGQLKEIVETYKTHIRFASLLGCGVVGTETGAPNEAYAFEPACHSEEALALFIERIRPVVAYAEKMGVILAIEPVFTHIVSTPKRARRVLDAIDSPNLQIILDPVNLLHISNYRNQKEIFEEAIDLLGKDVAIVHIKDFVAKEEGLVSMAAGLGEMDYTPVIRFIKERKPYIQATLEDTIPENAVQAREFIQKLWEEA